LLAADLGTADHELQTTVKALVGAFESVISKIAKYV
jgi:hypothetical protein